MNRRDILKALGLLAAAPLVAAAEPLIKAGPAVEAVAAMPRYDVLHCMFTNASEIMPGQVSAGWEIPGSPDVNHFLLNNLAVYMDSHATLSNLTKLLDTCRFSLQIGNAHFLDAALCHLNYSGANLYGPVSAPMPLTPALVVRPNERIKTTISRELPAAADEISEPVQFQIVLSGFKAYAV